MGIPSTATHMHEKAKNIQTSSVAHTSESWIRVFC